MLVLFDIDGTLLRRLPYGDGQHHVSMKEEAFMRMVKRLWSLDEGLYTHVIGKNLRGMTDFEIILELTARMGISREEVLERMVEVKATLIEEFEQLVDERGPVLEYRVLPGVKELLDELKANGVELGLATGNLEHFARHKLRLFDLNHLFTVGGFGDGSLRRREIVSKALEHARQDESYLVGDTPADIEAAHFCNVRVIAVATGGHTASELSRHSPDLLLEDLTEKAPLLGFLGIGRKPVN